MKKLVSLLLALTMLLGTMGTLATADEVKPTLTYPKMTATVNNEGILTIAFDNPVKDYNNLDVHVTKEGYGDTWPWLNSDNYDTEKKAYVCDLGSYYAGATVEYVNANYNKREDGKIDDHQYTYENGEISQVISATGTYKYDEAAGATTYVTSARQEFYEDGAFSGYRVEEKTEVDTSGDVYKENTKTNYKVYGKDGVLERDGTQTNNYTSDYKNDENGYSNKYANESKEDYKDYQKGVLNRFGVSSSYYSGESRNNDKEYVDKNANGNADEYTQNNDYGVKRTTGKSTYDYSYSYRNDYEKGTYDESNSNHTTENEYNKKGVLIYTREYKNDYTYSSANNTHDYKSEYMRYDSYGNLLEGSSNVETNAYDHYKYYDRGALSSTEEYEYELDENGNRGNRKKYTSTEYLNNGYGASAISYQYISTPNRKKYKDANGNEYTRYLNDSYIQTNYDTTGAVTSATTYEQDYEYNADEKSYITTSTTKQYTGAVSEGELKQTEVYIQKQKANYGDYENIRVTTDYAGKEIARTENSQKTTPATETTKYKRVTVSTSTGPDNRIYSKTVTTETYDDNDKKTTSSVRTNADGKVVWSEVYAYDKEEQKNIRTTTYNDDEGNLIGKKYNKPMDGGTVTNYYDKDNKLIYKETYTYSKYESDGSYTPYSYSYTDGEGKEIGYDKTDEKGQRSYKKPVFDTNTFTLNGWREYAEIKDKNAEGEEIYRTENKTYNKAGYLTYESANDGSGTVTTTYYSLYDEGKTLYDYKSVNKSVNESATQGNATAIIGNSTVIIGNTTSSVTTYNQNPNYVKSQVVTSPAETVEKDSKDRVTKRVNKNTTEYFDLDGKLDRSEVSTQTTSYTYDDDGSSTSATVTVTEWKNAAGSTVVTRTRNNAAKSGENRVEYKKADGTVIGYEKKTENDDKSYIEEYVSADINPYTGYVRTTSKNTYTYNKDGDITKEVRQSLNAKGQLTEENIWEVTETGSKSSEVHYYVKEDGTLKLGWDNNSEFKQAEGINSWIGHSYYQSGKVGRTWEGKETYDKEKDVWVFSDTTTNSEGKVVFTKEGTIEYIASGNGEDAIYDLTYKDGKGNIVGYKKTDANGTVTEKIPYDTDRTDGDEMAMTISGNLSQGWKETVTDVRGNQLSEKIYNAKGQLMSESYRQAGKEGDSGYWKYTGEKSYSKDKVTEKGITTTTTAYYNEDGSLRKKILNESGRASGTHVETDKTTVTDGSGAVVYTYEYTRDLRTEEYGSGVYKDASGKEIGHYTEDPETGAYSDLYPRSGGRTGKILGYILREVDEDGVYTRKEYDVNMKLLSTTSSRTETDETEDGHTIYSYYEDGNDKPWKVETVYEDTRSYGLGYTESVTYNKAGEKTASQIDINRNQSLVNYETQYYNQKGELVYSRLEMKDLDRENGYSYYTLYVDADGKEIGRVKSEDNGDRVVKEPETTFANNITGYTERITSEDGAVTITREYDKDNKLIGERYQKEDVVLTDDQIVTTTSKKDGTVIRKTVEDLDEDLYTERRTVTTYSRWDGRYTGESKYYPATEDYRWDAHKTYDENGNLTVYGWSWDENNYSYTQDYWANGRLNAYSWYDDLNEDGRLETQYNADGSYYSWVEEQNGTYRSWWYGSDGILDSVSVSTPDGISNYTFYNKDGSIRGYDWGMTSDYYGNSWSQDSVVWDANAPLYDRHVEADPNGGNIETWKDYAGNVKVSDSSGTTVKLANSADGWHLAFGSEWYLVEGGKVVTGWKNSGGTWYYFDNSGRMATGVVKDGDSLYAMNADGTWTASGWNQDADGNWEYIENGTVATGWKLIDGKWYYFSDGWYIDTNYDDTAGWKQSDYRGRMATGAAKIWNYTWTDQITYFFNADGTLDTTPGWKTDGIDTFYFDKNGERAVGWRQIGGNWYYFNDKGVMRNGWVSSGGNWYYMDETGELISNGWIQERFEDDWYYADEGGTMATGWRQLGGKWYYFNDSGDMASEQWVKSGDSWYYQTKSGESASGWTQDKDDWYYMDPDSLTMTTGWVQSGDTWYYMDPATGAMVSDGEVEINGTTYKFDANGAWIP